MSDEQRELVDLLGSSGRALMTLLNGVLDLSKLEAGGLALDPRPIDPRGICEDVVRLFAPQAAARGIFLAAVADPRACRTVAADEQRLRQVLGNLVGNAVKFTERGHVLVRLGWLAGGSAGSELMVEVVDSGPGLGEAEIPRLFEPFFQQASARGRPGGSGLGLAICKGLVEAMGGRIGAAARNGGGSRFWFTLPVDSEEAVSAPRLDGVEVLVDLEDEAVARDLARALAAMGARVDVGDAGAEVQCPAGGLSWVLVGRRRGERAVDRLRRIADAAGGRSRLVWLAPPAGEGWTGGEDLESDVRKLAGPLLSWKVAAMLLDDPPLVQKERRQWCVGGFEGHVLVVDDNPVNLEVAARIVQRLGCRVSRAVDGRQALDRLEAGDVDLVLMDCQMPAMDGYEATREIRKIPSLVNLPVVAVTAATSVEDREQCERAGMNDYLSKPVSVESIERVLRQWLGPRTAS
ncbi:MAG: response regulator [Acidobacteriota bacterium]|nr:response regulator [Acidobacteriota bacterium]